MRTKQILAVALMAAVGLLTLVTPAQADNRRMTTSPPVPSLTNVSATTQTPALFTITASLATTGIGREAGDGPLGQTLMAIPGGTLREAFANLFSGTTATEDYA